MSLLQKPEATKRKIRELQQRQGAHYRDEDRQSEFVQYLQKNEKWIRRFYPHLNAIDRAVKLWEDFKQSHIATSLPRRPTPESH